jgi:DNA-binding transcriptional MerR regulator
LDNKAPDAFRTISEVADELDLPQHVLRFWESRFREIKPMKRGGGRRYYRPDDVELLRGIRHLLYGEGYTIRGVQRILREQGIKFVQSVWQDGAPQPPHGAVEDDASLEEADSDVADDEIVEEERGGGLRGRLSSLIGRDFNEREVVGEARREPPLQGAPEPRIDADDRALHRTMESAVQAPPKVQAAPSMTAPRHAAPAGDVLSADDLRKLRAALHELGECRKLLETTTVPTD